jgi:SNF2 family DNA or RNA helicase
MVHEFQTIRAPHILLLQYQAGGTSITLTAADAMIFLSMTPSVIEHQQIAARIHRIGTTTHVQYLYLLAEGTVDQDLHNGLKAKADVVALTSLLRRRIGA